MSGVVEVFLAKALVCFAGQCFPILYGERTPTGTFYMTERVILEEGYGGDNVLSFKETEKEVFSIHRWYRGSPGERRLERLRTPDPTDNKVSNGCINVDDEVFAALLKCCVDQPLIVSP